MASFSKGTAAAEQISERLNASAMAERPGQIFIYPCRFNLCVNIGLCSSYMKKLVTKGLLAGL